MRDESECETDQVNATICEWIDLVERLRRASPHKLREVMRIVEGIVEGQEMIADLDRLLVLRTGRPRKRYRA